MEPQSTSDETTLRRWADQEVVAPNKRERELISVFIIEAVKAVLFWRRFAISGWAIALTLALALGFR